MRQGMIINLVSLGLHPSNQIRIAQYPFSSKKKSAASMMFSQYVQYNESRLCAFTTIKGKYDLSFAHVSVSNRAWNFIFKSDLYRVDKKLSVWHESLNHIY